jgi:hypothetical protein
MHAIVIHATTTLRVLLSATARTYVSVKLASPEPYVMLVSYNLNTQLFVVNSYGKF